MSWRRSGLVHLRGDFSLLPSPFSLYPTQTFSSVTVAPRLRIQRPTIQRISRPPHGLVDLRAGQAEAPLPLHSSIRSAGA